jgi:hypothetical protein
MGKLRVPLNVVDEDSEVLDGSEAMCDWNSPWPRIAYSEEIKDDDYLDETIGHEVIHGWIFKTGLSHLLEDEMQEAICDAFAPLLVQLLEEVEDAGR